MKKTLRELVKCGPVKTQKDREGILAFLRYHEFTIPDCDTVLALFRRHEMTLNCVVYMHNGPSQKMTLVKAVNRHPHNFATLYVGEEGKVSTSTKMIQIGNRTYWFDFSSTDNWRANQGDYKCELVGTTLGYHPKIDLPLFSIDFVRRDRVVYAIDFDLLPGAKNTPLGLVVSHKEIKKLIRDGITYYENKNATTCLPICN